MHASLQKSLPIVVRENLERICRRANQEEGPEVR